MFRCNTFLPRCIRLGIVWLGLLPAHPTELTFFIQLSSIDKAIKSIIIPITWQ